MKKILEYTKSFGIIIYNSYKAKDLFKISYNAVNKNHFCFFFSICKLLVLLLNRIYRECSIPYDCFLMLSLNFSSLKHNSLF